MNGKTGKIFVRAVSAAMILASVKVFAAGDITVTLNGKGLEFDVPPQIINDRTMVPLRAIFEALGAEVLWDNDTRTVTSVKDDTTVKMTIDSTEMYVNGNTVELDTPAQIVSDRTLVPVRAIAESFGAKVDWDGDTKTVIIESAETETTAAPAEATSAPAEATDTSYTHYAGTVLPDFGAAVSREQESVEPPTGKGTSITHRYAYTSEEKDSRETDIEKYIALLTDSGWTEDSADTARTVSGSKIYRAGTASAEIYTNDNDGNYYVCVVDSVSQKSAYKNTDLLDFGIMSGVSQTNGSDSDYAYTFADAQTAEKAVSAYRAGLERFYWTAYTDHGTDGTIYKLTEQGEDTRYSRQNSTSKSSDVVYIRAEGNTVYIRTSVCFDGTKLANYIYFTSYSNRIDGASAKYNEEDFDLFMNFAYNAKYEEDVREFETGSALHALPHMYMWELSDTSLNMWGYVYYRFGNEETVTERIVKGTYDAPDAAASEEILSRLQAVSEELVRVKPLKENSDFANELVNLTDYTYELLDAVEPYDDLSESVEMIKSSWENLYFMCESGSTEKFSITSTNLGLAETKIKSALK